MRALLTLDAAGRVVVLSTDDAWLAEQYEELREETLDVADKELEQGRFYLWTGKSQLTYPSPLDGMGPDGSEFVRTRPLEPVFFGEPRTLEFAELLGMFPPAEEEIDLTPRDTIWD